MTKQGKTWNVSFQHRWLEQFLWLSYSAVLSGGTCRYCILFPEPPVRGSNLGIGNHSGIFVLAPYQKPYSKALGKDSVLVCHEQTQMHCHSAERADLFLRNFSTLSERVDVRLMREREQQVEEKHPPQGSISIGIFGETSSTFQRSS